MQGKHAVYIRSKNGTLISRVNDYVSLHMLKTLNNTGDWSISSVTREHCPFSAGDGIIDVRNGKFLYGGVVTQISDNFDAVTGLYNWTAQGKGDLEYLNRRLCYLSTGSAYYTDSGFLSAVTRRLIQYNLGTTAVTGRKEAIIKDYQQSDAGPIVSVSLRYNNLLNTVIALVSPKGWNVRANWDEEENKVFYDVYQGRDLTENIVFTEQLNNIMSSEYLASVPEGNAVLVGGSGIGTSRQFVTAQDADSINQWGRIEFYQDGRNEESIGDTASATLKEKSADTIGYGCTASTEGNAPQYGVDYELGDLVGMKVHGNFVTAEVQQVEISVEGGIETVEPRFGTVAVGKFRSIFRQLADLRKDVDQLLGTEIE